MLEQYIAHDYYILDTYFPLLIFWLIFIVDFLPKTLLLIKRKTLIYFLLFAFIFNKITYEIGYKSRKQDPLEITRLNFKHAEKILDSLDITKNKKILLIDSYSPNLAFIGMKRKGYCVMNTTAEKIKKSLTWKYDYIITQNFSFKEHVLSNYPNFNNETKIIFSNHKFTIYLKK